MLRLPASQVPPHLRQYFRAPKSRPKSLLLLPERYRIACVDQLGLIARAVIVWAKPNGLPESVTDRVRRSHEDWVHLTKSARYFSAVDEIREGYSERVQDRQRYVGQATIPRTYAPGDRKDSDNAAGILGFGRGGTNPLGKLPGSVWTIPTEPLDVPKWRGDEPGRPYVYFFGSDHDKALPAAEAWRIAHPGRTLVKMPDHFAAYPKAWPRRIIAGWSPSGVCVACGEGRRPVVAKPGLFGGDNNTERRQADGSYVAAGFNGGQRIWAARMSQPDFITGYACACPDTTAPTRPSTVLDPFGGTGTTALVASVMGRTGISLDMSADYCRLAEWRTNDPGQRAAAAQVEKPDPVHPDQLDLFSEEVPA